MKIDDSYDELMMGSDKERRVGEVGKKGWYGFVLKQIVDL